MTHQGSNGGEMQPVYPYGETSELDTEAYEEDSMSWGDICSIEWIPKEIFVKFRQHVAGYQLGANFEFDGMQVKGCNTKLVLKPVASERKWKILFEPKQLDLRLLSKKFPIGPFFNLQFGVGHEFRSRSLGWSWKISSSFGGSSISQVRQRTILPVFPGFDLRVGWNAEYVLPDIHGALGTGEPVIGMNVGQLYASLDRVDAIFTHAS